MSLSIIFRPAEIADAGEIARLTSVLGYPADTLLTQSRLGRLLTSSTDIVYVAESDRSLCGWIHGSLSQLLESDYRVEIGGLVVDPAARRERIGMKLVEAVQRWATHHGALEVSVRCHEERREAHIFYQTLGFRYTKTQKVFRKRTT